MANGIIPNLSALQAIGQSGAFMPDPQQFVDPQIQALTQGIDPGIDLNSITPNQQALLAQVQPQGLTQPAPLPQDVPQGLPQPQQGIDPLTGIDPSLADEAIAGALGPEQQGGLTTQQGMLLASILPQAGAGIGRALDTIIFGPRRGTRNI